MPLATSTDHGKDLPTVQLLIKKNQVKLQLFQYILKKLQIFSIIFRCCIVSSLKGKGLVLITHQMWSHFHISHSHSREQPE